MKVSVLIPCYNASRYLATCLASVFSQTYSDFEIILVDDGSTDNSVEIANSFHSSKLKIYSLNKQGACRARNIAFEHSSGDLIVYLDADDIISPDKLKRQVDLLKNSGPEYISSSRWAKFTDNVNEAKEISQFSYKNYDSPEELFCDLWLRGEMLPIHVWMTPRNLISGAGPWNETLLINQDGEFFNRVVLNAKGIVLEPDSMVYYRSVNPDSITRSPMTHTRASSLLHSYDLYVSNFGNGIKSNRLREALSTNYFHFIYLYSQVYPDLCKFSYAAIEALDIEFRNNVGGKKFRILSNVMGFKYALAFRSIFSGK